jgi:hypothetical protein
VTTILEYTFFALMPNLVTFGIGLKLINEE